MKKNLLIALIAAAAIAPVAAQAETYVGANIGRAEQTADLPAPFSMFGWHDSDTAYKLYGGYQFNKNFGIEGGYVDMGTAAFKITGDHLSSKAHSMYLAATGTWPIGKRFGFIAKVGAARNRASLSIDNVGQKFSKSDRLLGVGASFAFTENMLGVLEYEDFGKLADGNFGVLRANVLSLGLRARF